MATDDTGKLELTGYGREYGHHNSHDEGRFAYVELEGDFDVAVQIESVKGRSAPHPPRGGIMAREIEVAANRDGGARYRAVWAAGNGVLEGTNDQKNEKPVDKYLFDFRSKWGGSLPAGNFKYHHVNRGKTELNPRRFPNVWLRMRREGSRFYGLISKNGVDWNFLSGGSWESDFASRVRVGVAMTSSPEDPRGRDKSATVVFANLSGFGK